MNCPRCNHPNPPGYAVCQRCGTIVVPPSVYEPTMRPSRKGCFTSGLLVTGIVLSLIVLTIAGAIWGALAVLGTCANSLGNSNKPAVPPEFLQWIAGAAATGLAVIWGVIAIVLILKKVSSR